MIREKRSHTKITGRPFFTGLLVAIRERFGDRVADIVAACSDTFEDPKPEWRKRKQAYIKHLRTADRSTLLVSAAGKLHNARATLRELREHGPIVWQRFSATRNDTLANYRNLIDAYQTAETDARRAPIVEELRDIVDRMSSI